MNDTREAQRFDKEATKKPGLAVVMATKRAISKLRKPAAAVGKSTTAPINGVSNVVSGVGKNVVLAMEVNYIWHFDRGSVLTYRSVDVELR